MGRNTPASRIYFFLCFAGLTSALLSGCSQVLQGIQSPPSAAAAQDHLQRGKKLLESGNYEASLKENQSALALTEGKPPADEALFNMGLITAHSKNPAREYAKALVFFERVVREYPHGALTEQAKIWVEVLQEHQRVLQEKRLLQQEKEALGQEKMALAREKEKLAHAVEESRKIDVEIEQRRRKARVK